MRAGMSSVAHQHHEGRGDVLAEAGLAVEPEFVRGVVAVDAGLQGVDVAAGAQPLQHRLHEAAGVPAPASCGIGAHLGGQRDRSRVRAGRQRDRSGLQLAVACAGSARSGSADVADRPVAHQVGRPAGWRTIAGRALPEELRRPGSFGLARGATSSVSSQGRAVGRLQGHLVAACPCRCTRRLAAGMKPPRAKAGEGGPFAAVELGRAPDRGSRARRGGGTLAAVEAGCARRCRRPAPARRWCRPSWCSTGPCGRSVCIVRRAPERRHPREQHETAPA